MSYPLRKGDLMAGFDKTTKKMKFRLFGVVFVIMMAVTAYVSLTMYNVAVRESDKYQELANSQQFTAMKVSANRGSIYDANGQVLAQSVTVYTVYVDPMIYKERDTDKEADLISALTDHLNITKEDIYSKLYKDNRYQVLKKDVDKATAMNLINELYDKEISCVGAAPTAKRYYPQDDLAANVIGHMHYDGYGIYGLEAYYDEYLTGIDGKIITAVDAHGNEIQYKHKQSYDAQDGASIYTNIDSTIQYYVEKALESAITSNKALNRGCAIVMECDTGKVLAMATEHDYNLNSPTLITDQKVVELLEGYKASGNDELYTTTRSNAWNLQWTNKAISSLYFPGSVFKVITGSAALEEDAVSLADTYYCSGEVDVQGQIFHCWTKTGGHGTQNFIEAMTNSCNPAFVAIGQKLGGKLFSKYFEAFGFTEKTGIDLPAEANSIYAKNMTQVTLASSSFGQTNKITPIQMITAYSAVVNGGYLVTPYIVNKIVDADGNVVKEFTPTIKRQVISEETSALMRDTLETVVTTKSGSNVYIKGYSIGGKSGTSQKIDENPEGNTYVSSYCAFYPAEDPKIIMLVMIDEPTNGLYYGSAVAAPVVSEVFTQILPYLGYYAQYSEEELENLDVNVPDVEGADITKAKNTIAGLGLDVKVIGDGETVVKQVPSSSEAMPKGCTVVLYTEEDYEEDLVLVPDLSDMSLSEANKKLAKLGLNLKPLGGAAYKTGAKCSGVMNYKDEYVPRGTIIEAYFIVNDETG